MNKSLFSFLVASSLLSVFVTNVSCTHIPTKPIVEYDSEKSMIKIIQTDTTAHDSAHISISNVYYGVIPIKDTIALSVLKIIKSLNQIEVAYNLATNNCHFEISVRTTRTNDTIFQYSYTDFEIKPIMIAEVKYGQCAGLYDVNYKRDFHDKIRQWIFKNDLSPDSLIIEKTNSILRQLYYSGKKEYSALNGSLPIVPRLSGLRFRFQSKLRGKYFYLYAYSCKSGYPIKSFVESKIMQGLNDACHSANEYFSCSNSGGSGPNVLFLVSIDDNWKYEALPVGIVVIDNIAPTIKGQYKGQSKFYNMFISNNNNSSLLWAKVVKLQSQNILVNIPKISTELTSSVSISYGNFEGNDYYGYNIPFYINFEGDVKSITIDSHRLDVTSIKNGECRRLHIKSLHTGDNSLSLSAIDSRGNKSTSTLSIPIVSKRRTSSYSDDYDELENRISDLESRIEDLE